MLQFSSFLYCIALCLSLARAKVPLSSAESRRDASPLAVSTIELPLDHFNTANSATFSNRYWVNDKYYVPGGPVIFFDGGESDAEPSIAFITADNGKSNAMVDLAERFGALLILWEHRYYGQSLPAQNSSAQGTLDDVANYYQYLTFEQALEDVVFFAKSFSLPSQPNSDFRPNKLPWVFVGGSYPGVRAAWIRLRNPEVIFASLSSSAPVQLQEDFWQYWVAVERKLTNTAGYESCLTDMHAMAEWATSVVARKDVSAVESFLFNATLKYNVTQDDSTDAWNSRMLILSNVFQVSTGDFQNSGLYGGLGKFCNNLKSSNYTNDGNATATDLQDGIVAYYGINRATEIYASVIYNLFLGTQGTDVNPQTHIEVSIKHVNGYLPNGFNVTDNLSWTWQTCLEAGFFQVSNPSRATNIIPGFVNLDAWIALHCTSQFGSTVSTGPNTTAANTKYGGWHLRATNVFSTNGEYDPWRALSVASDIDPSVPHNVLLSTTAVASANASAYTSANASGFIIPAPNTLPANGTVFGFLVEDGLHTSDLNYDLAAVRANTTVPGRNQLSAHRAHEIFASALSLWLPAYTPFAAAANGTAAATRTGAMPTPTPTSTQSFVSVSGAATQMQTQWLWRGVWVAVALALGLGMGIGTFN